MRLLLFIGFLILLSCQGQQSDQNGSTNTDHSSNDAGETTETKPAVTTEPLEFTTNLDNLRLRDEPGTDGKELARLSLGTKVYDAGEVSNFTTPLKLRGVAFDEPWIKIKTANGITGWIYGGGLSFNLDSNNPAAQALMNKRLAGMFGTEIADDLEIYRRNYEQANTSEAFARVYDEGIGIRERFVELLEKKIEVNHDQLPDLFWLKQAIPGYIPQLAAEGTIYYLFNDYKQFLKKAGSTSGTEDDEMAELFLKVHQMDSIEHFFPAWFMQTWDYGGHSLLGRGIHSQILELMDQQYAKSKMFALPITDLKTELINDITVQHSAYWEPKDKVIAELEKIIAAGYGLLTKEDAVALETRLKMMKTGKENEIEFNARAGMGG